MDLIKYVTYKEASEWAARNNIKTTREWCELVRQEQPAGIPISANHVYKDQWQGWSSFLQNGRRRKTPVTASYEECQKWAQKNSIQTAKQWYQLKDRLPDSMPSTPDRHFKIEWNGWADFLGTNKFSGISVIERVIRLVLDCVLSPDADDHRKQSVIGFSGKKHMVDMCYPEIRLIVEYDGQYYHYEKEEVDAAKTKDLTVANWKVIRIREGKLKVLNKTWDVHVKKYRYEEEKVKHVLIHINALSNTDLLDLSTTQKQNLTDLIDNLDLFHFYQKLGLYNEFVSYEECQQWALAHKITTREHWKTFKDLMGADKIPYHPNRTYRNAGWVNWPTFLQNGQRPKNENWATYEEASKWAQDHKIKSAKEWYRLGSARPAHMPQSPEVMYKSQWLNWPEFLKNGKRPNGSFLSYDEASFWARENSIQTGSQWMSLKDRPDNLPRYPDSAYKERWVNWSEFLGVEPYRTKRHRK